MLPRSWQQLINNGEIRGTSLKGYLYPESKFNLDLLFHSDHTCLPQAKSQTSYFHTSASSHNSDLDMKYSNAALTTVIGSEIPHHKLHRLCALCFKEEVASTCGVAHMGNQKKKKKRTPGCSLFVPVKASERSYIASYVLHSKRHISKNLFGPYCGKRLQSESVYDVRACVYMCGCAGVQREQSGQANRQAHWVPVRSGARWSVSGNDT